MRTGYAPSFIRVVGETGRARLARSVCTSKGRQNMLAALRATSQRGWGACVAPRSAAPLVAILAVLALLLAAWGGDSPQTSPDSSETSTPASGTAPASTPESPTTSAAGVTDFGLFYVDPDGWGVLESETSYRLTGNRLEDLDGEFVAEERGDGTWAIVKLP